MSNKHILLQVKGLKFCLIPQNSFEERFEPCNMDNHGEHCYQFKKSFEWSEYYSSGKWLSEYALNNARSIYGRGEWFEPVQVTGWYKLCE